MKNNRREFLKFAGLTGIGLAGSNLFPFDTSASANKDFSGIDHITYMAINEQELSIIEYKGWKWYT